MPNFQPHADADANEPLKTFLSPQKTPKSNMPTLHIIDIQSATPSLKLFRLLELPGTIVQRVLTGIGEHKVAKAIQNGFTCRAVSSKTGARGFVFNGGLGHPLPPIDESHEAALLAMAPFHTIVSSVAKPAGQSKEADSGVRYWRFKEGQEVRTSQWLAGMGATEQYDPDEAPVIPRDAKKLLVVGQNPALGNPALGRVRVPKGMQTLQTAIDSEDDSSDDDGPANRGFQSLLQPKRVQDARDTDSTSEASHDSDSTASGQPGSFSALLRRNADDNTQPSNVQATAIYDEQASAASAYAAVAKSGMKPTQVSTSSGDGEVEQSEAPSDVQRVSSAHHEEAFPSYGKEWAVVDTAGVTGSAASQARWELKHGGPPKRRLKSGVHLVARPSKNLSPEPIGSAPMSLRSGRSMQPPQNLPAPPALTFASTARNGIRTEPDLPVSDQPWVNMVVQQRTPSGRLIDDKAPPKFGAVRLPPGLGSPPGLHAANRNLNSQRLQQMQQSTTAEQSQGYLISLEETETPSSSTWGWPPLGLPRKPLQPVRQVEHLSTEDGISERLKPVEDEPGLKKYTMRQKAQKKGKNKTGTISKAKGKAELPKPDPVPPPRPKKENKSSEMGKLGKNLDVKSKAPLIDSVSGSTPAIRTASRSHHVDRPENGEADMSAQEPEPPQSELQKLLSAAQSQDREARLEVQFGLALFSHTDKALCKAPFTAQSFAAGAVRSVDFLPRLTTSTGDATHLLGFPETLSEIQAGASTLR